MKFVKWELWNPSDGKYGNLDLNRDWVKTGKPTRVKCWDDAYHQERITEIPQKWLKKLAKKPLRLQYPKKQGNHPSLRKSFFIFFSIKVFLRENCQKKCMITEAHKNYSDFNSESTLLTQVLEWARQRPPPPTPFHHFLLCYRVCRLPPSIALSSTPGGKNLIIHHYFDILIAKDSLPLFRWLNGRSYYFDGLVGMFGLIFVKKNSVRWLFGYFDSHCEEN